MTKYYVSIPIFASINYEIEAETEEEATEKAYQEGIPSICYHCSKNIELIDYDDNSDVCVEIGE